MHYLPTSCENIDLPLPTDKWNLDAIQILIAYSHRIVRNSLSTPAQARPVCCDQIAPHICDRVLSDGICLFRAILKEITGTEGNHIAVHHAVLQYLRQNASQINYDPTFSMTMCTDPVRKAQFQQDAVSRYITTHHMDRFWDYAFSQSPQYSHLQLFNPGSGYGTHQVSLVTGLHVCMGYMSPILRIRHSA